MALPYDEASTHRLIKREPWRSTAVAQLARRCGKDEDVMPMMIEGPAGTVLAAVGDPSCHRIAGDVLARVQEERFHNGGARRGIGGGGGGGRGGARGRGLQDGGRRVLNSTNSASGSNGGSSGSGAGGGGYGGGERKSGEMASSRGGGQGGRAVGGRGGGGRGAHGTRTMIAADQVAFGCVYEHRDCFGRARFVGDTASVPEEQFEKDRKAHRGVGYLLSEKHGGTSEVIW